MKKIRVILWVVVLLSTVLALGIYFVKRGKALSSASKEVYMPVASLGGPFQLTDQHGVVRRQNSFPHKYLLVYFGYSYCPDICPTGLQSMTEAMHALKGNADKVQPLFITVDPTRDTPAHLKTYMTNFHPKILALSGSDAETQQAMKGYKVYAAKRLEDETETTDYLIDHSSIIYLMNPEGKFIKSFSHSTPGKEIAATIQGLLKNH